jgi:hypothetical protein
VVHVHKGQFEGPCDLDRSAVDRITAYLFHAGGNEDPEMLIANQDQSFQGSIVLGMGFTFDDTDKKGVASSLAEMHRLIAKDPRNAERIFPYIGGKEVNDSPTHTHHRYVISFEDFPLRRNEPGHSWFGLAREAQAEQLREGIVAPDYPGKVAADWPDLLSILERRVKPERDKLNGNPDALHRKKFWWLWGRYTPALFAAAKRVRRLLAQSCGASPHLSIEQLSAPIVPSHALAVFALDNWAPFTVLQSRVHEVWARFMASSMKDDLRYTPSDCFETFPFPVGFQTNAALEMSGNVYYDFRATLMVRHRQGLTKTYNRFHDPGDISSEIVELRRLHDVMDRTVLNAYGWETLQPVCEFCTEFGDQDDEDASAQKKKRFRYRWPDEIRDDVLARLLILNQQRYEEEVLVGLHDRAGGSRSSRRESATVDEEWDEDQGELEL